jgi:glutamate/tyrosine decarboxylase-like PLP-dependent enzyme
MGVDAYERALERAKELAVDFLRTIDGRTTAVSIPPAEMLGRIARPLPDGEGDPVAVIEALSDAVAPGLSASMGPRYFGFVVGGSYPAGVAADWLTSAWDQNAGLYALSPAAAAVEEVTAGWLVDLFGLPAGSSVGFTTGATMATFTGLAAGRHALLARAGWDVERQGLIGAPDLPVVIGEEAHVTVSASLQMLGLGRDRAIRVPADGQGRMRADILDATLGGLDRPALVSAQAGNVNTGSFDPLPAIAETVRRHGGWLHVDGAFGLWAAASPALRHLTAGLDAADSWTTDAHKWLNVPYDSGIVIVRDAEAHRASMSLAGAYYVVGAGERDPYDWVAESSRRARAFPIHAVLATLGRSGVAALVDGCCAMARRFAESLDGRGGAHVLNEVVLNQVLVRFAADGEDDAAADARTRAVIAAVQHDGTCWLGGTTWKGRAAMRISVSSWKTTAADVDASVQSILRCAESVAASPTPAAV